MKEYKRLTVRHLNSDYIAITETKQLQETRESKIVLNRLVELEDKIENGTLIELPCKVGDTVYEVRKVRCSIMDGYREFDWDIRTLSFSVDMFNAIGKSIFLTREEAKKVLEEKVREMLIAEYKE